MIRTIHLEVPPMLPYVLLWHFLLYFSDWFTSGRTRSLRLLNRRVQLKW